MRVALSTLKIVATACVAAVAIGVGGASAATKAEREAVKEHAEADYKLAISRCDNLASGNPKDVCKAEAKAAREKAFASADAEYKGSARAQRNAAETAADADYDVAMRKCDGFAGDAKDDCRKSVKARFGK